MKEDWNCNQETFYHFLWRIRHKLLFLLYLCYIVIQQNLNIVCFETLSERENGVRYSFLVMLFLSARFAGII